MLRASADANDETVDMLGVGHPTVDSGVPGDAELTALTDAVVLRDHDELPTAVERAVGRLGAPATVRAIAVAGNFEMMNRLLDATGVGPTTSMRPVGDLIGVPLPARLA
jgi:hypothetical protein